LTSSQTKSAANAETRVERRRPKPAGPPPSAAERAEEAESSFPYLDEPAADSPGTRPLKSFVTGQLSEVNKELWLILSLLVIAFVMNYLVTAHRMILGFYTLPTLFSAYFFGRRHATLTAFASVFLVGLLAHFNDNLFGPAIATGLVRNPWYDLATWGGMLVITAYAMGTLHERHAARVQELQQTYQGLLIILRQFISNDKYTENHSYRVSIYAATLASHLNFSAERVEEVRAAALLHDIGKLEISRRLLYKAASLSQGEFDRIKTHVNRGANILEPVGVSFRRVIPIILAHHDRFDGPEGKRAIDDNLALAASVIAVADVYDALTSDRPYRKAMSPYDAKETIVKGAGAEFDPRVVRAFLKAHRKRELEIPEIFV